MGSHPNGSMSQGLWQRLLAGGGDFLPSPQASRAGRGCWWIAQCFAALKTTHIGRLENRRLEGVEVM